jgi:hypothetical protein
VRNHPRLGSNGRQDLVALSFQLANLSILGAPTRLGGITGETESHPGAEVAAEQALRLGAQELRPAGADPPRRRPRPEARNTVAIVVADTLIPSFKSSPWMRT